MRWAMRIFGAANIFVSLFGLYFFAWLIQIHLGKWRGNPTHQDWGVFFAISAVSTLLVLCVAYLGVRLILGDLKAIWQIGCVFLMEIVFFYVDVCVTWLGMPDSKAVISVSFWGIAMTPVDSQVALGYAPAGLVVAIILFLIQRRRAKLNRVFAH